MATVSADVLVYRRASERCPYALVVELIGERWTFLILRGTLMGLRHFEEFQSCLGIARNILSDRLGKLVSAGVLLRSADRNDRRKVVYSFSERGEALLPVIIAIHQWGVDSGLAPANSPVIADKQTQRPIGRLEVHAADGRKLGMDDLTWLDPDGKELNRPFAERPAIRVA